MIFAKFCPPSPANGPTTPPPPAMHAFDRKASSYHENAHVQQDSAHWLAEWLPPVGNITERCLEFGAGTGNLTCHLLDRFELVEATDISPQMVEQGRLRLTAARWCVRDAWAAPSPAVATWDYIVSSSMLQWAPEPTAALTQWAHQLKGGGKMLCGIYISPSLAELGALLPTTHQFPWRTEAEWLQVFAAVGLRITRAESITRRYPYLNSRALMRRLHDTGVAISSSPLPASVIKRLLRDYDRQYACSTGVVATWSTLRIEATR